MLLSVVAWSPDGKSLAFTSPRSGTWSIWLKDLASSKLTRLTDDGGLDVSPVWSPDDRRIAFLSNRGDTWGIWLVSANGGDPQLIWEIGDLPRNWDEARLEWQ